MAIGRKASRMGVTEIGGTPFVWGSRTYVMGVVNVTPDSFSGDGIGSDVDAAKLQALRSPGVGRRHHRCGRRVDPSTLDILGFQTRHDG